VVACYISTLTESNASIVHSLAAQNNAGLANVFFSFERGG
jgi:hypothetical protein